jgi:hypothetical protein
MEIVFHDTPEDFKAKVLEGIKLIDALVWGNQMKTKVDRIVIYKNSMGKEEHPEIVRGLYDCYNAETRTCELHIGFLIGQGSNSPTNTCWSVCHDLAHAFDVAYGNLILDKDKCKLTYMGRDYLLRKGANTHVPEKYKKLENFRSCSYYQAHDYYEPWEVRPLMAADACMAELNRAQLCPNLMDNADKKVEDVMKDSEEVA